jgi:hypothetical protein
LRDFILNWRPAKRRALPPMTTDELAEVHETQRQVTRLKDATSHRHSLRIGTPEYDAAVRAEERLMLALWHRLEVAPKSSLPPPK